MKNEKAIEAMQRLAQDGAYISVVDENIEGVAMVLLGGVLPVKGNWIVWYQAFPDGPQDLHDCAFKNAKVSEDEVRFKDQYGRTLTISRFEDYEKEEKTLHSDWLKALETEPNRKDSLAQAVRDRINEPDMFINVEKVVNE